MRVLFDHQVFDSQVYEGASRYFVELARHLESEQVEVSFAVRETDNVFLHSETRWSRGVAHHRPVWGPLTRWRQWAVRARLLPYMATFAANQRASEAALAGQAFDIFHPTYYEPYFLPLVQGKPYMVTAHDMIHELFPEYVKPGNPTTAWKRAVFTNAAHIIAVSERTKQDLLRFFEVPAEKVSVIHHGVGRPFTVTPSSSPLLRGRTTQPYLLYVGGRGRYKNFSCLLQSLPRIRQHDPNVGVICVGGGEFTVEERDMLHKLGLVDCVTQVAADDEELASLYRGAAAFVFPSLYEGFGMPILEAFACGCPVVVSRASAFPEVAGESALYFDPKQPEDLARTLKELLSSKDLQMRLRTSGHARATTFTWQKAAHATLNIYQSVLQSH